MEVVDPLLEPELHIAVGLLLRLGDVHRSDEAPAAAIDRGPELLGALLRDRPVVPEHVEAGLVGGADGQQSGTEASGGARAGGRDLRCDRHFEMRMRVRPQVEPSVLEREPLRLHRDGLFVAQEQQDGFQRLLHAVALGGHRDAHHEGVGRERAGSDPEHDAALGQVVEQHHAVGQHQRVVIGERRHPRAEAEMLGPLRRGGDEHLGAGDDLVAGGVMLADPRLVVPQLVEALDEVEVALEGERGALPDRMERGKEDAEAHRGLHSPRLDTA